MEGAPLCLQLRSLALPERPVIFSTGFSFIILSQPPYHLCSIVPYCLLLEKGRGLVIGVAARDGGSVLGALLDIRVGDND